MPGVMCYVLGAMFWGGGVGSSSWFVVPGGEWVLCVRCYVLGVGEEECLFDIFWDKFFIGRILWVRGSAGFCL